MCIKHIEKTLEAHWSTFKVNVFWAHCEIRKQHIEKHIVARAHCGTHWEIPMCPMCRAAQCARNTLKHITTHWNTLAYYLIWRGVQIKWLPTVVAMPKKHEQILALESFVRVLGCSPLEVATCITAFIYDTMDWAPKCRVLLPPGHALRGCYYLQFFPGVDPGSWRSEARL